MNVIGLITLGSISTIAIVAVFALLIWAAVQDGRTERLHRAAARDRQIGASG